LRIGTSHGDWKAIAAPCQPPARRDRKLSFAALATQKDQTPERLRAAMNPQHSRMPDLQLSKQQQDDLVAYILSLRQ
jgi:hypothetical protein